MRTIFSFIKPYKLPAGIALALTFLEIAIELLLPFFLGLMINQGVMNEDIPSIIRWGSIMIALALFSMVLGVFNSFYASHVSYAFGYDIRKTLFAKIQNFSFANLDTYPSSGLITRFTNDVRQIQHTLFMGLRVMAKAPLTVAGGVIMAFVVNAQLALVFVVTVPLLIGFLLWILRKSSRMFITVQKSIDRLNRVMQENLSGMRTIKTFFRRNFELNRFTKANHHLANSTSTAFRFVESSMPILMFVMNLSLVFIIAFGNIQAIAGGTNVGEVVTIVNYALRVSMSITMFSFIILAFSRMKASSERISEVLQVDSAPLTDKDNGRGIEDGNIVYEHVSFHYPKNKQAVLTDVTFNVQSQESLAIIGATGSGKTSLLQLIPRLYDSTNGEVFIDGQSIRSYPVRTLRTHIGYVPQSPLLFTGSIKDNILWGKNDASMEEITRAAQDAQIHDTIMALPDGYHTRVGQKGVNLSGGQKQRISIARALIRQPKILILDDSTSALDLATEGKLLKAIETYRTTLLIVTQKISTASNMDRILLLDDGEILGSGTNDELMEHSSLYRKIVESQYKKEYHYVY